MAIADRCIILRDSGRTFPVIWAWPLINTFLASSVLENLFCLKSSMTANKNIKLPDLWNQKKLLLNRISISNEVKVGSNAPMKSSVSSLNSDFMFPLPLFA